MTTNVIQQTANAVINVRMSHRSIGSFRATNIVWIVKSIPIPNRHIVMKNIIKIPVKLINGAIQTKRS